MTIQTTSLAACLSLAVLVAFPVWAEQKAQKQYQKEWNAWETWDSVARQPDAQVTIKKEADGQERRDILLPGKVSIRQWRGDGRSRTEVSDISGLGAVMCANLFYLEYSVYSDCQPKSMHNNQMKMAVQESIDRINDFVVANSPAKITKEELREGAHQYLMQIQPDPTRCEMHSREGIFERSGWTTPEALKKSTDKLLSVPRPPAIEPCL